MPDTVTAAEPVWVVLALALLAVLAAGAAAYEGVLVARSAGTPVRAALTRPLDETARLLGQRRRTTWSADSLLWRTGGAGLLVVALLMVAVVPFGDRVLAALPVGVVWVNTLDVAVWALVWLVGWGANSVYSLVGGYRFLALALGYELPLMFALTAPAVGGASLDLATIAQAQDSLWFVVWMPVAFVVYLLGVAAFSVGGPFVAPVGTDVVGGVLAELSGVDRLVVQTGRYALLVAGSAVAVPLFLGGGAGPGLPGWLWVLVKTVTVVVSLVWVRHRLPTLRPDRLMEVGWVVLLPAVLLQDLAVAVVVVVRG